MYLRSYKKVILRDREPTLIASKLNTSRKDSIPPDGVGDTGFLRSGYYPAMEASVSATGRDRFPAHRKMDIRVKEISNAKEFADLKLHQIPDSFAFSPGHVSKTLCSRSNFARKIGSDDDDDDDDDS